MGAGHFLDTNILFDAIYDTRPLYKKYHDYFDPRFGQRQIAIVTSVDTEANKVVAESAGILSRIIRNAVISNDWGSIDTKEKDKIIKQIKEDIKSDQEVKTKNRSFGVTDAFNKVQNRLLSLTVEEISEMCDGLVYATTRHLQERISLIFVIVPVDAGTSNYKLYNERIKKFDSESKAFGRKNDKDFGILSEMMMLIIVGARFFNNFTLNFDNINFYTRDVSKPDSFLKNFEVLKTHISEFNESDEQIKIFDAIKNIQFNAPY